MKAKKICAMLLASALAVGTVSALAACKKDDDGKDDGSKFVEDTRLWYAVGRNTKGTLSKFDNFYPQDTSVAFTRDTTVTDENVFTLSLDIYADPAGYGFKFLYKTSAEESIEDGDLWTRQVGIHNFEGVEGEDENAVIKDAEGKTVFTTKGGMDANNLYLAKGQEGTYTFTLKTKSDTDDAPVITWKKTAKIDVTHDMYVRGDINDFGVNPIPMTEVIKGDVTTWTAQIEITKADLWRDAEGKLAEDPNTNTANGQYAAIQIYNDIDKKTYATIEGLDQEPVEVESFNEVKYTCVLVPAGNYAVTYHQADNKITYKMGTHEMYFIGPLNDWNPDNAVTADYKLTEKDGTWTGTIYLKENGEFKLYNGLKLGDNSAWCGVSGEPTEAGVYASGEDNIKVAEEGLYQITYNPEDGAVTVEKLEMECILVGTFYDADANYKYDFANGGIAAIHPRLTNEKGGVVISCTLTVKDVTSVDGYSWIPDGGIFAFKPVMYVEANKDDNQHGVDWNKIHVGSDNVTGATENGTNILIKEEGTYTVTYNLNTQAITVTKNA